MEMQQLIAVLKNQVTPALGCTEPGAVALAVARAKELLGEPVRRLEVSVDKNILKNGMDVGIPGTSERGIVFAAALALVVGRSEYSLEVLRDVTAADIPKALELVAQKIITLQLDEQADGLTIRVRAFGDSTNSHVLIRNAHTNIVFEARGEEVLIDEVPPTTP
ncbi:MAG: serine dehydratase subunit alpha family protein, partial [Oscillospiraceae bacterium]